MCPSGREKERGWLLLTARRSSYCGVIYEVSACHLIRDDKTVSLGDIFLIKQSLCDPCCCFLSLTAVEATSNPLSAELVAIVNQFLKRYLNPYSFLILLLFVFE